MVVFTLAAWVMWGNWPNPTPRPLSWPPDAVVVLGGGDKERSRQAAKLAGDYPHVPLIVSGDGGTLYRALLEEGVDSSRITHETLATSTLENARFTGEWLNQVEARRIALVTNGFHAPRAHAIFSREYPQLEFEVVFEPRPTGQSNWYEYCERRERLAALHNLVFHGVWSF
ncbi:MAG: YdcF family protein [Akkermansiaceae bacterium]|nr:YdcF family protein [Akkermansiaceae bacterium]